MLNLLREAARDALSVLFPIDCAGCGARDRALCPECRALLSDHRAPFAAEQYLADGTRVVSALRYERQCRSMILAFKEEGRTDVARALSWPLRSALTLAASTSGAAVEVCVIPSSRHANRRRGYSPVELLTRAAGFRVARVLRHTSVTQEQKALDRLQRSTNLQSSLTAAHVAGRTFILVDDVVTTGATLREAARALRQGGALVHSAATLAFTPRRNDFLGVDSARVRDILRVEGYGG